jgi:deoxyribodipyrimidine photolyase
VSARPIVVWFRLDLRLHDNPALLAATQQRVPIIPTFIWAPEEEDPWPRALLCLHRRRYWAQPHKALEALTPATSWGRV